MEKVQQVVLWTKRGTSPYYLVTYRPRHNRNGTWGDSLHGGTIGCSRLLNASEMMVRFPLEICGKAMQPQGQR